MGSVITKILGLAAAQVEVAGEDPYKALKNLKKNQDDAERTVLLTCQVVLQLEHG